MKQFQFRLATVLDYKQKNLDDKMMEHAVAIARTKRQEEVLAQARRRLADCQAEYEEKKITGITIMEAMKYETGMEVLEREVVREHNALKKLQKIEEEKRLEVVEAKKETTSLERLRDIRKEEYDSALQKMEEKTMEDLIASKRVAGSF